MLKTGILEEVDCKIRSLVEALWLVDVPTRSSCEGHLDHGDPYSHVAVVIPVPLDKRDEPERAYHNPWGMEHPS